LCAIALWLWQTGRGKVLEPLENKMVIGHRVAASPLCRVLSARAIKARTKARLTIAGYGWRLRVLFQPIMMQRVTVAVAG